MTLSRQASLQRLSARRPSSMPHPGAPRLDDSFAVRATRRARSINEKKENAMTPKANTPDIATMSDDQLARDLHAAQYVVNAGGRDPSFGRATREEGLRRLDVLRAGIAGQVAESTSEIVRLVAKSGEARPVSELARLAGLLALANPKHSAWAALASEVAAPDRPDRGPNWSTTTDAEHDAEQSERASTRAAARGRLVELTGERERRRLIAEAELEAERVARYTARRSA